MWDGGDISPNTYKQFNELVRGVPELDVCSDSVRKQLIYLLWEVTYDLIGTFEVCGSTVSINNLNATITRQGWLTIRNYIVSRVKNTWHYRGIYTTYTPSKIDTIEANKCTIYVIYFPVKD